MKPVLIEIGSEEIPARYIAQGLALLKDDFMSLLETASIPYGTITEYGTPRRLALFIENVAEKQDDRTIETLGPPVKAAYDADGNPTRAATGFAGSLNIDVADLIVRKTDRGEYVAATVQKKGAPTIEVLSECLPKLISSLHLPRSMRWGNSSLKYFRPIQWILAMIGNEVIPFALDSIKSSNVTYGHRFLSPAAIKINGPASYVATLKQNHVYADPDERKNRILEGIGEIESAAHCRVHEDAELLDIVTNLVEYPAAVMGTFEDTYLSLPGELLITVMKTHQKYFSMEDSEGNMKSCFIVISNMNKDVNDTVRRGAERVLRARLEDARFYYIEDQKHPFWDYVEKLKKVTFQEKLGTLYEKAERISSLASRISEIVSPDSGDKVRRASMLCKADLVSGVVGEFPELQGYMGMIYSGISGEDSDVASALFHHYMPRFPGDSLPSGTIGTIISLADKMDNIVSFFYIDMVPSGSEDPFALRRQAAGIINILQGNAYPLSLNTLIDMSLNNLGPPEKTGTGIKGNILHFFTQRLETILAAQGHSQDIISAVLSVGEMNISVMSQRIQALSEMKKDPAFPALLTAAKRVYNILAKARPGDVKEELLSAPVEKTLCDVVKAVNDEITITNFNSLFTLEKPINEFFEGVLVMDDNPLIKDNRLALLLSVKRSFDALGDFSRIGE